MSLCDPIPRPTPPVPANDPCLAAYNADCDLDDAAFAAMCAACEDDQCRQKWRDWAIKLRTIRLRALAACLDGGNESPPSGYADWEEWADAEAANLG